MTIETKYNIGDEVWAILGTKACKGKVLGVTFAKVEDKLKEFYYGVNIGLLHGTFKESQLFPTKEELLNSL